MKRLDKKGILEGQERQAMRMDVASKVWSLPYIW
jgi:hypothetical protein